MNKNNKKKNYQNHPPVAFWLWNKKSADLPALKLPKNFRKQGSLRLRTLKNIKIDKKTGEYLTKN